MEGLRRLVRIAEQLVVAIAARKGVAAAVAHQLVPAPAATQVVVAVVRGILVRTAHERHADEATQL
ncbi:MAG TPA: hypothetical protein VFX05_01430, partial [Casimicrobiaceae bacterium]|nr:hypothetical protein [Casimicrobiaceae bacterium]